VAIEETFRREFQTRVEEALDPESARFLMAHLPPVPWPDVATKHDLDNLTHEFEIFRTDIDGRFRLLDQRFLALQTELTAALANQRADLTLLISSQTRTMIIALITAFVAISSLALFR